VVEDRVFAAAAALVEFSTTQLAAYSGTDPSTVQKVLSGVRDLVDLDARGRWRVLDLTAVRSLAAGAPGTGPRHPPRPTGDQRRWSLEDRLVQAEETMIECSGEKSPALRRVMTTTARNRLLQVLARLLRSSTPWWRIEASDAVWRAVGAATEMEELSPWRLRANLTLTTIIDSEAVGDAVSAECLTRTAMDISRVTASVTDARLTRLFEYLVDLTATLAGPAGLTAESESAPARLLVALAWQRTRALAGVDVGRAAKTLVQVLRQLSQRPRTLDEHTIDFYRLVGRVPGGRRVVVYRGLLDLLPHRATWQSGDCQPGVLVETVTDPETSHQLENMARQLRDGLERSPFRSESALIGGAAHVLHDVAMTTATRHRDILPRSDLLRRELLELAGIQV
jgi:hypothetical protein